MKNSLFALSILFFCYSCNKKTAEDTCIVKHIPLDYAIKNKTLIPINTTNFWTYVDSIFDPNTGSLIEVTATLIKIEDVYEINGLTYFDFTESLPSMTAIGDTLFSMILNEGTGTKDCYTLKKRYFPVEDTVYLSDIGEQMLYKDYDTVPTGAGNFSGNIVYKDGENRKVIFHEGIGIIKASNYLGNGTLRRSLTLKDYRIN